MAYPPIRAPAGARRRDRAVALVHRRDGPRHRGPV